MNTRFIIIILIITFTISCECPEPQYIYLNNEAAAWKIPETEQAFSMRDQYNIKQDFSMGGIQYTGFHVGNERGIDNCVTLYEEEYYVDYSSKMSGHFRLHMHAYEDIIRISVDLNSLSFSYDFDQQKLIYLSTPENTLSLTHYADGTYDGDPIHSVLRFMDSYENEHGAYGQTLYFELRDVSGWYEMSLYVASGVGLVEYLDHNGQHWKRVDEDPSDNQ